ncbi:MAG: hypothetical protein ACMXX5_00125 [Candidatus Woesearchaeota archaeon]
MKLLTIFVLIFLVFGGFLIVRYNNYRLDNPDEAVSFAKDYGIWLFGIGRNVASVTGAAIREAAGTEGWIPKNDTDENKTAEKTIVVYE